MMGGVFMQFCQRLKEVRENSGETQSEVAALLNTSRQQYSRWEKGDWQMPIEHYKALAEHFNVSVDYLAGLTDEPRKLR